MSKKQNQPQLPKVWLMCHGPAIEPKAEKCASPAADSVGGHQVEPTGDGASYNGIRTWRCPECFTEHRRRIAARNQQPLKN